MRKQKGCLLLSLILVSLAHGQEIKEVLNDSIKNYTIQNCVNQFNIEQAIPTKVGYQYWFADKDFIDGRTLKLSVVVPHQSTHAPHKHIEDEFFFVLEGTAEFFLDGKTQTAGPYTSFYCPSNSMHGISNVGDTELKYLVIKKYKID
ncbi:mannose-6-phosphate isomerase-like protein (cupin superfamily) [Mariniflexile fucanivorans]|uniref:Mannose-6-phosphate isomerase-like protein (Cupin superfamily) n=1 Tax=Mariniflexile fucanivorans TaxID=264023 RepID=A0A4R1RHJ3_9FLAO|nr:cupin domain-containing protein [Mariniflexile fucanivorans]TCL65399.1 mannose-6-phosphate isomerase-like protein (cupin superfamily) [Mariniflexile fucanivorans]